MDVLGHEDRGLAAGAGREVTQHGLGDLLLELAALRRGFFVAGARLDVEDWRKQRDELGRVQPQVDQFAREAFEAFRPAGVVADPAAELDQLPNRVESDVAVERRAVQLENSWRASLGNEFRYEAGLAYARIAVNEYAGGATFAPSHRPRPGLQEQLELGVAFKEGC